jgi:hypothetical protein
LTLTIQICDISQSFVSAIKYENISSMYNSPLLISLEISVENNNNNEFVKAFEALVHWNVQLKSERWCLLNRRFHCSITMKTTVQQTPPFTSTTSRAENRVSSTIRVPRLSCTNREQSKSTNSAQQKNQIVPLVFVSAAAI